MGQVGTPRVQKAPGAVVVGPRPPLVRKQPGVYLEVSFSHERWEHMSRIAPRPNVARLLRMDRHTYAKLLQVIIVIAPISGAVMVPLLQCVQGVSSFFLLWCFPLRF